MSEKLKPCPFCGGSADIVTGTYHGERKFWKVYCKVSQCRTWCEFTRANAVNAWNTRSIPEGYALVPVGPTDKQREVFEKSINIIYNPVCEEYRFLHYWKAMIAATQEESK